jgi:hypothetical protein
MGMNSIKFVILSLLHLIKKEMPINISGIAKSKQIALPSF